MNIGNKIKVQKAALHRVLSPEESAFLFEAINFSGSMSDAYDTLEAWGGSNIGNKIVISTFSFDDHIKLSSSILSKVKDEIIAVADLEEINR